MGVSTPRSTDGSPIRETWSLKRWFTNHREPAEATSAITLRPTFFRREPQSVRPFPPRTFTIGIPGLFHLHVHLNSTRKSQAKGWNLFGNRLTWSTSKPGEYRLRRAATRQVKRDIRDSRDPRFSSSGSFGQPQISDWSTALRANPYYQWGLGEQAGQVNPMTGSLVDVDPFGRPYNPSNPYIDPYGNTLGYSRSGDPLYMDPRIDPSIYGAYPTLSNGYLGIDPRSTRLDPYALLDPATATSGLRVRGSPPTASARSSGGSLNGRDPTGMEAPPDRSPRRDSLSRDIGLDTPF
jgi:hypothetical protein